MKIGFDLEKYISLQSEKILERIEQFGDKLYLEFGGKIFDDYHASRVLPGFLPDTKIQMLHQIAHKTEVIIAISSENLENKKLREDTGLSYDNEVFRMIDFFKNFWISVNSVVITMYKPSKKCDEFIITLKNRGISHFFHYEINGYPTKISEIVSENGFGKNDYIPTTKPLVVVTAPGPGSGKMATCLSQMYHENLRGIRAWYAKFETFPVWNLALSHPVNLAYESATLDIHDSNMVDPFYLEAYNEIAINYNRDIEVFPILKEIFEKIYTQCPYKSPTDMGVNMVGFCFKNEENIIKAAQNEIIRRHYNTKCDALFWKISSESLARSEMLITKAKTSISERKIIQISKEKSEQKNTTIIALEIENSEIITGKSSQIMTAWAALIINTLKFLANIDDNIHIISPHILDTIKKLKTMKNNLSENNALTIDEILIAIAISATTSPVAQMAIDVIPKLRGLDAHSSKILEKIDIISMKNLWISLSMEDIL